MFIFLNLRNRIRFERKLLFSCGLKHTLKLSRGEKQRQREDFGVRWELPKVGHRYPAQPGPRKNFKEAPPLSPTMTYFPKWPHFVLFCNPENIYRVGILVNEKSKC